MILPEARWRDSVATWQRAEELGFAHVWTYDHLAWRGFRDDPWFTAIPLLTAVAAATSRVALGTLVASANFRHPLTFAKDLIALDDISEGRVIAGVGAGGRGWDATMLGQETWSTRERAERFAEFVELTELLFARTEGDLEGQVLRRRRSTHVSRVRAKAASPAGDRSWWRTLDAGRSAIR